MLWLNILTSVLLSGTKWKFDADKQILGMTCPKDKYTSGFCTNTKISEQNVAQI